MPAVRNVIKPKAPRTKETVFLKKLACLKNKRPSQC